MHPNDGGPTNPFPYLNKATRLLFAAPPGSAVTLSLKGTVLVANATQLKMKVATATVFPVGITLLGLRKPMVLTMTKTALVGRASLRAGKTVVPIVRLAQTAKTVLVAHRADARRARRPAALRPAPTRRAGSCSTTGPGSSGP